MEINLGLEPLLTAESPNDILLAREESLIDIQLSGESPNEILLARESPTEAVEDLLPPVNSFSDIDDLYELLNEDFGDIDHNVELYLECNDDEIETATLDAGCPNAFSGIKPLPVSSGHSRVAVNIPTGQNSVYRLTFPGEEVNTSVDRGRFQCDLCVKSYARSSLLLDHKSVAHGVRDLFVCDKCVYKGQRYRHWYKHMKRKHAASAISVDHISCEQRNAHSDHDISHEMVSTDSITDMPHGALNIFTDLISGAPSNIALDSPIACDLMPRVSVDQVKPATSEPSITVSVDQVIPAASEPSITVSVDQLIPATSEPSITVNGDYVYSESTGTVTYDRTNSDFNACCGTDLANITKANNADGLSCGPVQNCTWVPGVSVASVSSASNVDQSKSLDLPEMTVELRHVVANNEIKAGSVTKKNVEHETYSCSDCSKTFDKKRSLMYHKRIHVKDRAYLCMISECRKAFKTSSALNEHKTTVHGAKVYKCSHRGCAKVYAFKRDLTYHQNVHDKCYQCRHAGCEKVFRDSYNLSMHTKTHTGQKTVQCPKCEFACIQKNSLDWHLRTKHMTTFRSKSS